MNIHTTTQNLISLADQQPNAKLLQTRDFRNKQSYLQNRTKRSHSALAFKASTPNIIKKVAKSAEKPSKILEKKWFRKLLDLMDHEVLVQAIIAALVCMVLRPLTIMGLSIFDEKSRKDNAYAAAHGFVSGLTSIGAATLISFGFSHGVKNANFEKLVNNMLKQNKDISKAKELFKKMRPDIDFKTVFDETTGKVKEQKLWRTIDNKKVLGSMNDVLTVARPTHYSECSADTYKSLLGKDIDISVQKDKSLLDITDKDGNKIIDNINIKDMFIAVKEEGMGGSHKGHADTNFFSLLHIDKDFLKKIDSSIDIQSIEKDGKRLHPTEWKNIDGTKWLNSNKADNIHFSSFFETTETTPVYTGRRRVGDNSKYASYLANIENYKLGDVPRELGTEVTNEFVVADKNVESKKKLATWLPDIVTRPFVAATTIALIPWALTNVFKVKKSSNKEKEQNNLPKLSENKSDTVNAQNKGSEKVAFKGLGDKLSEKIGKFYAKFYANSMLYNNKWLHKMAEKINKADKNGNMSEHMSAFGSLITSGTYAYRTFTNDKLEKDNKNTLVINQLLCFAVPTALAYTINRKLGGKVKAAEYAFSGAMKGLVQRGQITENEYNDFAKKLPKRLKSVKTLASLATFTLIYRYVTPVIITPVANFTGRFIRNMKQQKANKNIEINSQNAAQKAA